MVRAYFAAHVARDGAAVFDCYSRRVVKILNEKYK
jgi:hypothetical protein